MESKVKKKIYLKLSCFILLFVFTFLFCTSQSVFALAKSTCSYDKGYCSGKAMVVMETQNNNVLYSKNMKEKCSRCKQVIVYA